MTDTDARPAPTYPANSDLTAYGCRASLYEEGGFVVFGSGRRALAAASLIGRGEQGPRWATDKGVVVRQLWGSFATECGCTQAEHDAHTEADGDCYGECETPQLPPCGGDYIWMVHTAEESHESRLPIVEVKW